MGDSLILKSTIDFLLKERENVAFRFVLSYLLFFLFFFIFKDPSLFYAFQEVYPSTRSARAFNVNSPPSIDYPMNVKIKSRNFGGEDFFECVSI